MNRDHAYIRHMIDAIAKIDSYVKCGHDEFMTTSHWQDAVIRELEILGEAAKSVSPALKKKFPKIPWRRIAGLRDVLIHNYMGVDLEAVWQITQDPLSDLKKELKSIPIEKI